MIEPAEWVATPGVQLDGHYTHVRYIFIVHHRDRGTNHGRRSVHNEIGAGFELGRFHEAALDHGSLPVKYLLEVTRERLKRAR